MSRSLQRSPTSSGRRWSERDKLAAREAMRQWKADPVLLVSDVFQQNGAPLTLSPRQAEIMRAVRDHARVAVRSGQKVGKSTIAVLIAFWFALTHERARVVLAAPTDAQVKGVLWKELRRIAGLAKRDIGASVPLDPATGIQFPDGREIVGRTTSTKKENLAGTSTPNLLYIVDEASGVSEEAYEALEGNRAGGDDNNPARMVLLSNPTQNSGTFFDAFHTKASFWEPIHVSSVEAAEYEPHIPGMATRSYIDERRVEWGEHSPMFAVRILGEFAEEGFNSVVPLVLVSAAQKAWQHTEAEGEFEVGVDVARFGDDETVIAARRGSKIFELIPLKGADNPEVAGEVLAAVRDLRAHPDEVPKVKVDGDGNGGGVCDLLRRSKEVELVEIHAAAKATAPTYHKLRDQLWFGIANWLREGGVLPPDKKLTEELLAPKYSFDANARYVVEGKPDLKPRLGRSPDRADAVALAIYSPPIARWDVDEEEIAPQRRYAGGGGGRTFMR